MPVPKPMRISPEERMFEMPYDRKATMLSEIESFISRLQVKSVLRTDLIFEGKEKDDKVKK